MKKSLLMIGALTAGLSVGAQQSQHLIKVANPTSAKYLQQGYESQFSQTYAGANLQQSERSGTRPPITLSTNETIVGQTKYTLQTNSSPYRRVAYNSDNTISINYTLGLGAWNSWPDRGTGYNYFDGTTWGPIATTRIESVRTGFPDILVLNNGFELNVAHNTANSVQQFSYRGTKGVGPWSESGGLISNPPNFGFYCLWPRMCVGGTAGDVIHHIAVTEPVANGGALYHGQDGCMMYSRSDDGGQTFATQNVLINAFDSTQSAGLNGDGYAIDASGNIVAIVIGGFGEDVVLAKSIDGGNTWTKTIVQDFPFTPWTDVMTDTVPADGIVDTLETNDASMSVLIDDNGMVHVWYGQMFIVNDGTGSGTSYFPGTAALMYWNESMGNTHPVVLTGAEDLNGNGVLDVAGFGTYQVSLVSHPTSGIDAAGNIYLAFSSIMENTDDGTGKCFRNIYAMKSMDHGTTWTAPYNVAPDPNSEKVFPSMSRTVTSSLHLTYMVDNVAGHGLFTGTNPDPDNVDQLNDIVYADVPVDDISGVHENSAVMSSVEVYPNPTNDNANISVNIQKAQEVTVSVYNATGALISSETKNLSAGTSIINLDVKNQPAGIYFVNITEGTSLISKKLIIE
jgi:hypothetical protein